MLSCSWHWKIPGMSNRRDLDSRQHRIATKLTRVNAKYITVRPLFKRFARPKRLEFAQSRNWLWPVSNLDLAGKQNPLCIDETKSRTWFRRN